MSTPAQTTKTEMTSPTRQQLDELESFLQQMLDVPLDPSAPETDTLEPLPPIRRWRPYSSPDSHGADRPIDDTAAAAVKYPSQIQSPREFTRDEIAPFAERITPEANATPGSPGLLRPIVAMNWAFDAPTYALGAFGRWLRSTDGRMVIGWTGLALLAIAAAWVVLDLLSWL